jgi:DNA-binding transcriptional ArsR family regulator
LSQQREDDELSRKFIQATAHPVRVQILRILGERIASPKQIAAITGEPVGTVAYHARVLLEFDFVELARTKARRGATEHFYKAKPESFLGPQQWEATPRLLRSGIAANAFREFSQRVVAALEAGTFQERDGSGLSSLPLRLDEEGWEEIQEILSDAEQAVVGAAKQAAHRLNEEPGIPVVVVMTAFELPGSDSE